MKPTTRRRGRRAAIIAAGSIALAPVSLALTLLGIVAAVGAFWSLPQGGTEHASTRLVLGTMLALPLPLAAVFTRGLDLGVLLTSLVPLLLSIAWGLNEGERRDRRMAWGIAARSRIMARRETQRTRELQDLTISLGHPAIDLTGIDPRLHSRYGDWDADGPDRGGWVDEPGAVGLVKRDLRRTH